jgi:hypothetical protein
VTSQAVRASRPTRRADAGAGLLDAAERLLVDVGQADLTTRRVAAEAGAQHGKDEA